MNYATYSAVDLALDDQFRRWVIDPTHEREAYWQSFLDKHPDQQAVVEEARMLVSRLIVNVEEASPETLQRMWAAIQQGQPTDQDITYLTLDDDDTPVVPLTDTRRWWQRGTSVPGLYRVAAGLVVFLFGGLLWWQLRPAEPMLYQTAFGKTQSVTLPDGSVVTLNGNSRLTVPGEWADEETRVVNLDGEAFFSVSKQKTTDGQPVKFQVRTADLTVEVLGTQFNVSHRRSRTEVVLQEGSVQISDPQTNTPPTLMQPGERVTYSATDHRLVKRPVDTQLFTSWRDNLLIFKDQPVSEIARQLEDGYGLRIEIRSASLAQRTFSGSIPTDSVQLFFTKLEKLYGVTVRREADRYVIE
jgi:transmembrane sensor